jgi:predicted adenylyl cyclase CyaB
MIEVEKKFLLNKEQEENLIKGAEFIGEKVFTDIYYDTKDYALTRSDDWLRQRAGKWELKLSLDKQAGRKADFYDEIEDDEKIKEYLKITGNNVLESSLVENGYSVFCNCKTTRRKYKKAGFSIDIDFVEYGDFTYQLAEIELMVNEKSEMPGALEKIVNFAKESRLEIGYVRGKVLVYLKEKKPEHFKALVEAGVAQA